MATVALLGRHLLLATFDPVHARGSGVPDRAIQLPPRHAPRPTIALLAAVGFAITFLATAGTRRRSATRSTLSRAHG